MFVLDPATSEVNSILYRRPSLVVTSAQSDIESAKNVDSNYALKPPDAINLTPPSPAPSTTSFLRAPYFLKVQIDCLGQLRVF